MPGADPTFKGDHFVCPHCNVDTTHGFQPSGFGHGGKQKDDACWRSTCHSTKQCGRHSYWVDEKLVSPAPRSGPSSNEGLQGQMLELYEEARDVAPRSPRAAAALLRLVVELIVREMGETAGLLNTRIGRLHKKGEVSRKTIHLLDAVRITGNEAVHEGQLTLDGHDEPEIVELLFAIVNKLADDHLTLPAKAIAMQGDKRRPESVPQPSGD